MNLTAHFIVAILVASIFATSATPNSCPEDRQCGEKKCKKGEFCQFTQTCEYGLCPSMAECVKRKCSETEVCNLFCIQGYTCKLVHVEGCGNVKQATCVPNKPPGCGNQ